MNWSLIILGLVALSGMAIAENSYLIFAPKLYKVGYDNQLSVFIAAAPQPVEVKYILTVGPKTIEGKITVNAGETRNATLALPTDFPVGPGELFITGTGGIRFEERRDLIVYDNRHVILVQTSSSTYRPGDNMEIRVVVTTDELIPVEKGEALVEIYDAALKLIGRFPYMAIKSGMTENIRFPISEHTNIGTWLVSATVGNSTSSLEVLVAEPITKGFDLKAIFQRFILRTEKNLRGVIEIDCDNNEPIFGRAYIAVGALTEADVERMKTEKPTGQPEKEGEEMWRKWKHMEVDVAGRIEFNYDIMSHFNIDVTKVLALQVYIRVKDLVAGQERFIQHIVPIFTRDVVYDIRPLEFTAGMENEFQVIAKRPDGKPSKMEDMIITITMMMGDDKGKVKEEKSIEVNKFYTRGRNDIGFFNVQIPESCIGVLMTITPLGDDGKIRGYRTHAVPLMPTPRREIPNAKLTIELLPSMIAPAGNDPKAPLVSAQISTVGRTSNFYIQLLPTKPVEKFEPLPMSYILMTNGRITGSGEFMIKPTKECQSKATRSIEVDEIRPPVCVFNGTLPIEMTRVMVPYSTLLVYTFQPSFGFNVAESYRFSVAGLFKDALTLNATIVPYSIVNRAPEQESDEADASSEEFDGKPIEISSKAQDKNRVQLSFTGTPEALVGLNVIEYDGVMQGLSSEITKERLLNYLTSYEQVPIVGMPSVPATGEEKTVQTRGVVSEEQEMKNMDRESLGFKLRYPLEKMVFGVNAHANHRPVESDDVYAASNMDRFYADESTRERSAASHYRRKSMKSMNQYDVTVSDNDYVVATSYPLVFVAEARAEAEKRMEEEEKASYDDEDRADGFGSPSRHGTPAWFEKLNSRLSEISQEAFTFMQSGLNVISDFPTLRLPADMQRVNLTKLFNRYRQQANFFDDETFSDRDEARIVLEQYLVDSDASMVPSPILLEEQARIGYYRSVFFNTSRIGAQGKGQVVLPRTKPYSTWLATGFSLHSKTGLAIAQPIRLPTNQGLFVLGSFVDQMRVDERALLTFGINNYLGKDLTNVVLRIHGSMDFDLMDGDRVVATAGKDYTFTIPSLKIFGVESRNITVVPKRTGVTKIVIEVESEFAGDYEVLTFYVRESGIKRQQRAMRLYELTADKKTIGPIVYKLSDSPSLRSVRFVVSGTGLDRIIDRFALETSHLVGVDRAIIRLWRALGLRRYLNETAQVGSFLDDAAESNITLAYQKLQLHSTYNGSYSFISDEGLEQSSFYLSTLSFGAMVSPFMTVRDNVTLNRTLTWLLAHQRQDGSFEDQGPCYHFRFCAGEYRRDGLTALFYYVMTRDHVMEFMPEFIRHRLFDGEHSPMNLAHRYLESRYDAVQPCMLTTALFELAMSQSKLSTPQLREKIMKNLRSRQLTVVPEDNSKFFKYNVERVTYDDQLLVNAMMLSTYANFGDYETASLIARWAVQQFELFPYHDTVLDSIFGSEAWLRMDYLYRKNYPMDKFSVFVDVTIDNDESKKQRFTIDRSNMDISQKLRFTLPVKQISYTLSGFGAVGIEIRQVFYEKQQERVEPSPFTLTNKFEPAPWFSEIKVETCLTYTPTAKELQKVKETFNRTIVVEYELPSSTRVNLRQIGFALSRVENMMYFTFDERARTLNFFLNMPQTYYGKAICFPWILERLSYLMSWKPVQVHAYDYLQQDTELQRLFPTEFQPSVAGYAFIDAVHEKRPSLEQLAALRKQQMSTKP